MPLSQLNYQYTCFFDVQLSSSPNSITAFKLLLPSLSQPSQSSAHYQEGKEERQKTKKRKNEKTKNLRKSRPKVKMRSNTKKRSNLKMRSNTKKSSTSPHKGTNSTASWPTLLARRDNRNHIKFNTRSPDPPEKPRRLRQHLPLPVEDEWRPRRLHLLRLQEDGCPAVRLHDAVEQLHRRELVQPPQLGDRGVRRQPKLGWDRSSRRRPGFEWTQHRAHVQCEESGKWFPQIRETEADRKDVEPARGYKPLLLPVHRILRKIKKERLTFIIKKFLKGVVCFSISQQIHNLEKFYSYNND